ncbi:tRNA (guanine-N7-)-methyltransferase [Lachnospiraceae bacterium KH1T2]|nr:tRNA (guanine-N7-)-methyltransferase [Lachnospiraceae bacterium KH1T2]
MRLRNIPGAKDVVAADVRCMNTPEETKGKWKEIFGNDAPVRVEVGMGKGRFIIDMAVKYPDINFVGIEMYESVMIKALKHLDDMEDQPKNVRFIRMDARMISEWFEPGEVDRIYLNFSDPWPKARHAKRRLESKEFLTRFARIIKKDGVIEFKTDNQDLFSFALEEVEPAGWELLYQTRDLHNDAEQMKDNVMTEYEEKFSSKGNPICKYIIKQK